MSWTTAPAMIIWKPDWVRKRRVIGRGTRYEGVGDWGIQAENPWSVLIALDDSLDAGFQGRATVTLRAHWAPPQLLARGIKFSVIEGSVTIAEVEVLENGQQTDHIPRIV